MSDAEALLYQASSVLAEASAYSNRAASWIARAALECAIDDLLAARGRSAPEASMRSKLSVLQVAYEHDPEVVIGAEYAWSGLSKACHYHAFQLTPSAGEAEHLIGLVQTLCQQIKI